LHSRRKSAKMWTTREGSVGKWAGAYRAEKRRKEIERQKSKEEKLKRLAARREQAKTGSEAGSEAPTADATAPVPPVAEQPVVATATVTAPVEKG
jgi:hypothetical protein